MEKKLYCATTYQVEFNAGADYTEDKKEALKSLLSEKCSSFSADGDNWTLDKGEADALVTDIVMEKVTSDTLDLDTLRCVLEGWVKNSDPANDVIHLSWF